MALKRLAAVLAALILGACGSDAAAPKASGSDAGSSTTASSTPPSCDIGLKNKDCVDWIVSVEGQCHRPISCVRHADSTGSPVDVCVIGGTSPQAQSCDDGNTCTTGDKCESVGTCAGTQVNCDDGSPCTSDSCDKAKGCVHAAIAAQCSDNDACTTGDACKDSACVGTKLECDDKNPCTSDSCDKVKGCINTPNTNACDDGNICTDGDVCKDGSCAPGAAKVCDDGKECTFDSCDSKGGCTSTNKPAGAVCDDNNPLTIGDSCDGTGGCKAGGPNTACETDADCAGLAGNACVNYTCDKSVPAATSDPKKKWVCMSQKKTVPDDGNPCTIEFCDSFTGVQTKVIVGATCSDGDACTDGDMCNATAQCAGKPKSCDDGDACTSDACVAGKGCASVAFPVSQCDDKKASTLDFCSPKIGCVNAVNHIVASCNSTNASCTVKVSLRVSGKLYPVDEKIGTSMLEPSEICPKLIGADDALVVNRMSLDDKGVLAYLGGDGVIVTDEQLQKAGGDAYTGVPGDVTIKGAMPDFDYPKSALKVCN